MASNSQVDDITRCDTETVTKTVTNLFYRKYLVNLFFLEFRRKLALLEKKSEKFHKVQPFRKPTRNTLFEKFVIYMSHRL